MTVSSLPESKRCTQCGAEKGLDDFHRDRTSARDGRRSSCKSCHCARRNADYRAGGRDAHLRRTFGITEAEFDAMLAVQGGSCAVCGVEQTTDGRAFRVDHDHSTGRVRGLLCHSCNVALGLLKDDVAVLAQAIAYLEHAGQSAIVDSTVVSA